MFFSNSLYHTVVVKSNAIFIKRLLSFSLSLFVKLNAIFIKKTLRVTVCVSYQRKREKKARNKVHTVGKNLRCYCGVASNVLRNVVRNIVLEENVVRKKKQGICFWALGEAREILVGCFFLLRRLDGIFAKKEELLCDKCWKLHRHQWF